MHEVTVCEMLLAILAREVDRHGGGRLRRVRLEIGRFACLEPASLRFAFEVMGRGTIAEAAVLEIDQPPGLGRCLDCGAPVTLEARLDPCPTCGSERVQPVGGDGMRIIEMEVA